MTTSTFISNCSTTTPTPPANKPPVVVTAIATQTATLGRSYNFVIPASTFTDPDGQLVSWTATNLPVGLIFDVNTHTISGTPSLIGPNVVTVMVTDNNGASVQTTFVLQVLGTNTNPATLPMPATLSLLAPTLDCTTGRFVFRSTGGDGTSIEYFAVGIKSWSKDSVATLDPWLRTGVTFTLQARQSGKLITSTFTSGCVSITNNPPVLVTSITNKTATVGQSYSFVIPVSTFTDPDGQPLIWTATNLPAGLTFDAVTHAISGTPSSIGSNIVTVTVTDSNGASVQTTFTFQIMGTSTMPILTPLVLLTPGYDCSTGRLIFKTSGGDGSPIEYMAVGIKNWGADSISIIDVGQRNGVMFTLQARQSGKVVASSFTTVCNVVTPPTTTTTAPIPTTSALVVVSPVSRIVYQRNNNNQANVSVIGQAPSTATRAEARLVPVVAGQGALLDWVNLPLLASKTFSTKLTHTGGWYQLEVRAWNGSTLLSQQTIDRVGIGEVFVISGQSNAYGGFEVRPGANDDRVSCLDYKDDDVNEALLPIRFSHMDISVAAGPSNPKHIWAELGDKLTSRLNVPVLFLGAAQGATKSEWWRQSIDRSASPFPDFFPYRRIGATLLHYIARTGARAILWHQGEGDQGNTTQSYVDNLTVVINKSRQQSSNSMLPWVMSRVTYVYGVTDPNIINAQNRLINELPQVFPGPATDILGPEYRPIDNVHISGIGATRFIEMWDQSLNADFFSRSTPFSVSDLPQITTGYIPSASHLAGQAISVPYVVSGNPDATSSFSVQLIRDADGSVVYTSGSSRDNPIVVNLPGNLANDTYRAKVIAPNLTSLAGESFRVGASGSRVATTELVSTNWVVWPNPAEKELTIAVPATITTTKLRVMLSTVSGLNQTVIESSQIENGQLHLMLPTLPTGLYFLHIYDGELPLQTLKVIRK